MSMKNQTPTSSPQPPKIVKLETPSTPPLSQGQKRLMAGLSTPDALHDTIPFSPSLKRTNSGSIRSPEPRSVDSLSPNSTHNLLKTPGNTEYDFDERTTPRWSRLSKTPLYFSPGKRLFSDDSSPNKKELEEISLQLKNRLSSALGSLQQKEKDESGVSPAKLDFSNGPFGPKKDSPKRLSSAPTYGEYIPSAALNRTNINLQTFQASPAIDHRIRHVPIDLASKYSPDQRHQPKFSMPTPDEESSAHTALLVALSKSRERRRSQINEHRRPSAGLGLGDSFNSSGLLQNKPLLGMTSMPLKLPPIHSLSPQKSNGTSEQEAVYSLMSLASPQANKHEFSSFYNPTQLQPGGLISSQESSRSSSVSMPVLPPISGLIRKVDDDETDSEDTCASDDDETS